MPFKHLTAPKVVASLKAEVCAIAQLEPQSLVGVLTTDSVSLAVIGFAATSPAKVTNVSLGSADDLAFINREVAVVRSGDDLWALIDIQHTARPEQVGRDMRSLHACPLGGTALALAWDGQAASLELRQYEVGGRQFVLRGDLRTADLGPKQTYVVVDGAAGGQFRVHPGLTPEAGASARVDLPQEASGLDRLRGGREMSALYQKGGTQICIVTKDGANNLAAKMILLEAPVLAAAVASTSLFAISPDGKLRLYNADALSGADASEPLAPTVVSSLPARGEPTALTVTTHAGTKLWVGTKAGDVIRLDATRAVDVSTG